jgi:ribose 5-phosphate isomerase A
MTTPPDAAALKRIAAERAAEAVEDRMVLGLGTGSTAALAVDAIGRRVRQGLDIVAIPTSEATAAQAAALGIRLADFGDHRTIDLTIDGADAVDRTGLHLIKGLGGALLREKIVAAASKRMIVIVDDSKLTGAFGTRCPVPVETTRFGWQSTERLLTALGCETRLRLGANGEPFVTDGGNFVIDCRFGAIDDPEALAEEIKRLTGVVESGLFVGLATEVIIAGAGGVEVLRRV